MHQKGKVLIAIILVLVSFVSLFPTFIRGENILVVDDSLIPEGTENVLYDYKYENSAGFIISAYNDYSCVWKPDSIDDGYKICTPVVEIKKGGAVQQIINPRSVQFILTEEDSRSPIQYYFSNSFNVYYESINETLSIERKEWNNWQNFADVDSISIDEPFAIKAVFEIPKYSSNHYNFNFNSDDLNLNLDPDLSACGTLNTSNSIYTLTQNINSTGTCFTITGNNVTLNCNGFSITYAKNGSVGYGVRAISSNMTTIKNCVVIEGNASTNNKYGVYFYNSSGTINNNTITTNATSSYGIYFALGSSNSIISNNALTTQRNSGVGIFLTQSSNNNLIVNNTISTNGSSAHGIQLQSSSFNQLNNINIVANGAAYGIYIFSGSNSNNVNDVTANLYGASANGIRFTSGSNNNTFRNLNLFTNNTLAYAIYVVDSNHNFSIEDSSLNASSSGVGDFAIGTSVNKGIWNFTNVTYSDKTWPAGANGTFNVHWWINIIANYTNSSVASNVSIRAWDKNNVLKLNVLTGADGKISEQRLLEYSQSNNQSLAYFSNYTINATRPYGKENLTLSINLTDNFQGIFTFDITPPIITLDNPTNNTFDLDGLVIFTYNVSDFSPLANCSLVLSNVINKTNNYSIRNVLQGFVVGDLTNGDYYWRIDCNDNSADKNKGSSETRNVQIADIRPPVISLINPYNGKILNNGNVTLRYTAQDFGYSIANCSLFINDTLNQTNNNVTESQRLNFTLQGLTYGTYTWNINCTDTSPNKNKGSSVTWDFSVNEAPSVTLNTPLDNSTDTDGDIVFNFTVQDDGMLHNCTLYHDIDGTFLPNLTNTFVQPNFPLYFTFNNVPNGNYKWNVVCYDDAYYPNIAMNEYNFTFTVNKTYPQFSLLPNLFWDEDNIFTLNLSNYFYDYKGDNLTYTAQYPANLNIMINNETQTAVLESSKNWFGNSWVIFTAFDNHGMSVSSNNATFTIYQQSDTRPRFTYLSPSNNTNDNDGYLLITCNATDDYNLASISLYSNTSGIWRLEETKQVTGLVNGTTFEINNASDGYYQWRCLAYDNASQQQESALYNINISIGLEKFYHDVPSWMVNNINTSRYVVVAFSSYLNGSLTLGNLTIINNNGDVYYSKNMSQVSYFLVNTTNPPLVYYPLKFNVTPSDLIYFYQGYTSNINFTLEYFYDGATYTKTLNHTIKVVAKPGL